MRLAICLYKLTRGDYHYTIGEMAGNAQSTVSASTKNNSLFFKIKFFLSIRFQIKVTIQSHDKI